MVCLERSQRPDQVNEVDLYADAVPIVNGAGSAAAEVFTGPAKLELREADRITGIGKIIDMDFGIAVTDQAVRTYPQLVTIGGGSRNSTLNVLRVSFAARLAEDQGANR
jgi:cleavage and polyadenylation specificity factor subunit 1